MTEWRTEWQIQFLRSFGSKKCIFVEVLITFSLESFFHFGGGNNTWLNISQFVSNQTEFIELANTRVQCVQVIPPVVSCLGCVTEWSGGWGGLLQTSDAAVTGGGVVSVTRLQSYIHPWTLQQQPYNIISRPPHHVLFLPLALVWSVITIT